MYVYKMKLTRIQRLYDCSKLIQYRLPSEHSKDQAVGVTMPLFFEAHDEGDVPLLSSEQSL